MRKQRGSAWHYHILKFINELGLNTKLASLKGEGKEKYQFDFPKTVGELICMQILDSGSKRHMFFTLSDSKETTMDGISLHHVYRALDILCRHSTETNTYSCKSAKKIIEKDSSIYFYDCTNLVYPRGCDGEFLGMKKSKERIFAPLVQMGLLIDENGFPVGMNIFKENRSKQLRLKEQIRQISTVIPTQKSMLSKTFHKDSWFELSITKKALVSKPDERSRYESAKVKPGDTIDELRSLRKRNCTPRKDMISILAQRKTR